MFGKPWICNLKSTFAIKSLKIVEIIKLESIYDGCGKCTKDCSGDLCYFMFVLKHYFICVLSAY